MQVVGAVPLKVALERQLVHLSEASCTVQVRQVDEQAEHALELGDGAYPVSHTQELGEPLLRCAFGWQPIQLVTREPLQVRHVTSQSWQAADVVSVKAFELQMHELGEVPDKWAFVKQAVQPVDSPPVEQVRQVE
jgi:hypothetical protein